MIHENNSLIGLRFRSSAALGCHKRQAKESAYDSNLTRLFAGLGFADRWAHECARGPQEQFFLQNQAQQEDSSRELCLA